MFYRELSACNGAGCWSPDLRFLYILTYYISVEYICRYNVVNVHITLIPLTILVMPLFVMPESCTELLTNVYLNLLSGIPYTVNFRQHESF